MCRITVARPHCYGCCQPLISGDLVGLEYCDEARNTQTPLNPLGSCGRDLTELTILDVKSYSPRAPLLQSDMSGWARLRRALAVIETGWGRERWEEVIVEFFLRLADDPRLILDPVGNASSITGEQRQHAHGELFFQTPTNKIAFLRAINNELEFTDALGGDADADYERRLLKYWQELKFHECGGGRSLDVATTIPESP